MTTADSNSWAGKPDLFDANLRATPVPWRFLPWDRAATVRGNAWQPVNPAALMPTICAPMLVLVPLDADHAAELSVTDAVTRMWIGWSTPPDMARCVQDWLAETAAGRRLAWVAYDANSYWRGEGEHEALGVVSLDRLPEALNGAEWELGFWLHEKVWGHGWALRMAAAVLDWTARQTPLRLLTISWTEGNIASKHVIEKLLGTVPAVTLPAVKDGKDTTVHHYMIELAVQEHP
ncbi:MAG: GNAT family N-acetyltransferase [Rhodospirillaceae bacterium]